MNAFQMAGACDCHSHVFGPFTRFPLSNTRTFDPPESPVSDLEKVWTLAGLERAVLVQGSAHGKDPSALLDAIGLSPRSRRGVVLLDSDATEEHLAFLHERGVRAVRFNWIRHLLGTDTRNQEQRLAEAAKLIRRVARFDWHAEIHIDVGNLELAENIAAPDQTVIVIDHMARIDMADSQVEVHIERLVKLLQNKRFWVKLSGADRLASSSVDLSAALTAMKAVIQAAPDRCVWGLDWPHVNLSRKRPDEDLVELIQRAAGDESTLRQVLVMNPAKLYGFEDEIV